LPTRGISFSSAGPSFTIGYYGTGVIPLSIFKFLDWIDYAFTLARLTIFDWIAGPPPETSVDRTIREEGERIRKAFPEIDFDHPGARATRRDDLRPRHLGKHTASTAGRATWKM
jgi:hypothetical protein